MEIIIVLYFAVNLFMAGYCYSDDENKVTKSRALFGVFINLFFSSFIVVFYYLSLLFSPIFEYFRDEILFWWRLKFTDYWDNVLLDDDYTDLYPTFESKMKRVEEISEYMSKQSKRHCRIIKNKYEIKFRNND